MRDPKEVKEHWLRLCEQAAIEQDPEKLMELINELNWLLEERLKFRPVKGTTQE